MNPATTRAKAFDVGSLLRGEPERMVGWLATGTARRSLQHAVVVLVGAGAFGAAMGSWRAPEQAAWSALKLPLLFLATATGNALVNGMLGPLLGLNLRLRESFAAVLTSFAAMAAMLGAFSPLMAFLVWNLPPPQPGVPVALAARSAMLLTLVGMIAFAGVAANWRLLGLLRRLARNGAAALRLLFAWLAVNLLLGSQLAWISRPFIGQAEFPVTFVEPHALEGNFFEELFRSARELRGRPSPPRSFSP
jgi:hypothetical protein